MPADEGILRSARFFLFGGHAGDIFTNARIADPIAFLKKQFVNIGTPHTLLFKSGGTLTGVSL